MTQRTLEGIAEDFALLEDWEDRYRHLIDLGRSLAPMEDSLKTDETLVQGCTSRVWMIVEQGQGGRYRFTGDSDAHIVRGLIAILFAACQDKTAGEIASLDIGGAFRAMGLDQHLSPSRRNGFFAMVERVKKLTS